MSQAKLFGVGFHKTGTTSLADALRILGYRVTGPNGVMDPEIATNALPMALRLVEEYDAFQDNPWPLLFRELDRRFPGSKFVLTERPTRTWIASVVKHFGDRSTPMREWIYGVGAPRGHEGIFVARYERHNEEVRAYFADRPDDLLVLRVTEGDGWDKLCAFLGRAVPSAAFPHSNPATTKRDASGRS